MKTLGIILAILGSIGAAVCGLGFTVSLVAWVLSLLGVPFILGAGALIFKFAGGWLISIIVALLGYGLLQA
jgi:hypothetical protein